MTPQLGLCIKIQLLLKENVIIHLRTNEGIALKIYICICICLGKGFMPLFSGAGKPHVLWQCHTGMISVFNL